MVLFWWQIPKTQWCIWKKTQSFQQNHWLWRLAIVPLIEWQVLSHPTSSSLRHTIISLAAIKTFRGYKEWLRLVIWTSCYSTKKVFPKSPTTSPSQTKQHRVLSKWSRKSSVAKTVLYARSALGNLAKGRTGENVKIQLFKDCTQIW